MTRERLALVLDYAAPRRAYEAMVGREAYEWAISDHGRCIGIYGLMHLHGSRLPSKPA